MAVFPAALLSSPSTDVSGILAIVTSVVTEAIKWIGQFVTCITSQPLLLMFVVITFVGLGVGLIRRIIRL